MYDPEDPKTVKYFRPMVFRSKPKKDAKKDGIQDSLVRPIWRKAAIGVAGLSTAYWIDSEFNACTFQRNIRTLWNGLCITLDYKLFFHPGADVSSIHQRVAERILYTCQKNAGLYVKFGQSVASMNHILPPQYNETLKSLFADAPIMEFDQVLRIFKEEFDCHPDDLFDEFERAPVASASIAQVHRARLKTDGTVVAVKVQKHYIRRQLFWDMLAFRFIIRAFEYFFELPLSWSADYTERHLREEIDFCKEADNADRARADFSKCSQLAETVYIPQVYREFSTERIMTSEWIEGISLTDKDRLRLEGYPITRIMHDIISAFSYQIFHSGFVHADPHPGNIIIRRDNSSKSYQICLIDHGLYVSESDEFRHQYCLFWKSLFLLDLPQMERICHDWGIQDMSIFASATLQRPFNPRKAIHITSAQRVSMEDLYHLQVHNKERIKKFLSDTEKIPLELIFVGRTLNLVRSNNKYFGSPVNRINLMAEWAVQGLGSDWSYWARNSDGQQRAELQRGSLLQMLRDSIYPRMNYWWFRMNLMWISVGFHLNRTVQWVGEWLTGKRMKGFEDRMDSQMIQAMRNMGIVVNSDSFEA